MKLATKIFLLCSLLFFLFSISIIWVYYGISRQSILDLEKQTLLSLPIANRNQNPYGFARGAVAGQQFLRDQLLTSLYIAIIDKSSQNREVLQDPLEISGQAKEGLFSVDGIYYYGVFREHQGQTFLYIKEMQNTGKTLSRLFVNSSYFTVIFTVLAGVIAFFFAKYLSAPILTISKKVGELNVEALDFRFNVIPDTKDEINGLKHSINKMLEKLEFGFMVQKRFAADASHELRTPVTSLLGFSKMLIDWGHSDPQVLKEGLEQMHRTAEDMKRLMENLLLLSKMDNQQVILKVEDKSDLISHIEAHLKTLFPNTSITFTDSGFPDSFPTSMEYFTLLLKIIVENALKFSSDASQVEIAFESDRICVRDYGTGIRESLLPHIFNRFYKSAENSETTAKETGFGLGLSIAREIARVLNLNIMVESEPGKGTKVSVFDEKKDIQASTFKHSVKAFNM